MGLDRDDLISVINDLKEKRQCFQSEDDFKFALALEIKEKYPTAEIRLEKPMWNDQTKRKKYLDIFLKFPEESKKGIGIEVKYVTAEFNVSINDEQYHLTTHGAYDVRSYDCLLDIERLEEFIGHGKLDYGYALWLTNAKNFWRPPKNNNRKTNYGQFRINEGRKINREEELKWREGTAEGTKKGRESPIKLKHNDYKIHWESYSSFGGTNLTPPRNGSKTVGYPSNEFKYSLNEIR